MIFKIISHNFIIWYIKHAEKNIFKLDVVKKYLKSIILRIARNFNVSFLERKFIILGSCIKLVICFHTSKEFLCSKKVKIMYYSEYFERKFVL